MALLREHHGPLRADFRRFYGCSIDDLRRDGVPLSEVADMAAHLPPESAVHRSSNPQWRHTHDLELARMQEMSLRILVWAQGKRRRSDFPEPYVFPWEDDPRPVITGDVMELDEIDDWLGWSTPE